MNRRLIIILTLILLSQSLWAQRKDQKTEDPNYLIDPETGKLSMVIRIWGEVQAPGVTMVPSDADLISLLSYVGGPTGRARLSKIRIIRFNVQPGEDRVVYANIEAFIETGDDSYMPVIYPNDTIIVNGTIWKVVNDILPYISITISLMQFFLLTKRA
ncbi:MAG: SLBB domain-containing protein [Candidatus Marinimicrobia bacterium]|nr:SLBB domain-containing protein [Candidatus Neomarinimicrobiota bacterium]